MQTKNLMTGLVGGLIGGLVVVVGSTMMGGGGTGTGEADLMGVDLIGMEEGLAFGVQSAVDCSDQPNVSEQECLALLDFYNDNGLTYGTDTDVCERLGISCRNNGITALRKGEMGISKVNHLSKLVNLTTLHLNDNNLTDLTGISGLNNLRTLYLPKNSISNLNGLGTLSSLKTLNLSQNDIIDVKKISNFSSLTHLHLSQNHIIDIDSIGLLENLEQLTMTDNEIEDISSLSKLKKLERLRTDNNYISNLDALGQLNNLVMLNVARNEISDVSPIAGLSLDILSIDENSICDIMPLVGNGYRIFNVYSNLLPKKQDDYDPVTRSWLQSYGAPGPQRDGECGGECGNGDVEGDEECDDENLVNEDACTNECKENICGDDFLFVGVEGCDDGNLVDGDGCSSTCEVEEIDECNLDLVFDYDNSGEITVNYDSDGNVIPDAPRGDHDVLKDIIKYVEGENDQASCEAGGGTFYPHPSGDMGTCCPVGKICDLNCDGEISTLDVIILTRYATGVDDDVPCCWEEQRIMPEFPDESRSVKSIDSGIEAKSISKPMER